ncbi:hypothetical protein H9P43_000137 [Blastocladiella emersonii ATCC 22665]|nr:hypothetical protein H9P43_000137 [Blastocladiella emersonii ATCC 22665]
MRPLSPLLATLLLVALVASVRADPTPDPKPEPGLFNVPQFLGDAAKQLLPPDTMAALNSIVQLAAKGENYIVTLKPELPVQEFLDHVAWLESKLQVDLGIGHVLHKYHIPTATVEDTDPATGASISSVAPAFYGYAGTFHPALVEIIKSLPVVASVSKDDVAQIEQAPLASTLTQRGATWGLARICTVRPPNFDNGSPLSYTYNFRRGLGVDVYSLDTGVYVGHRDIAGRAAYVNIPGLTNDGGDPNGHGSHTAGTMVGTTYGVAKGANVWALQVLDRNGKGPWSNVIKGIETVVNLKNSRKRPSIMNLSVTGAKNDALNAALTTATRNGVHVVVAAGNSNVDTCGTSPGSAGGPNGDVVSVGSAGQTDVQSVFSNWGRCNDISAPGEFIESIGTTQGKVVTMSGTSMASPHVAGALAVVLSQASNWTPRQAKEYLKSKASIVVKNTKGGTPGLLYLPPRV